MKIERRLEIFTGFATKVLGNSIVFILAFCLVIYWWSTNLFSSNNMLQNIGDIIFGIIFLSLFVIQKSFNKNLAQEQLKRNDLISSNEPANNLVIDTSQKTEKEIQEMSKEYIETDDSLEKELDNALKENTIENKI